MTDLTTFPIPTKILDPAEYPEFVGDPGPAIELDTSATHIQWRVVGAETWIDLIALADLAGTDGDDGADGLSVELQKTATHIQWKQTGGEWANLIALEDLKGEDGATVTVVDALDSTSTTSALSAAQGKALHDAKLAASGGTLTNVKESIYYAEVTENVTIDFANGDVQYLYVNPAGASIQITMPADPGAVSKAGILFVKNNTGKAHTWNTSPAIRFVDQADADTVPTPAAVGYYTRYTCQWMDNNAGTGAWWVTVAGRDTA